MSALPHTSIFTRMDELFNSDQKKYTKEPLALLEELRAAFPRDRQHDWASASLDSSTVDPAPSPLLARMRCMVQDASGSELFAAACEISRGDERRTVTGVLRDSFDGWEVSETHGYSERHCYVLVPVPGETAWFRRLFLEEKMKEGDEDGQQENKRARFSSCGFQQTAVVGKFLGEEASELKTNCIIDVYGVLNNGAKHNEERDGEEGMNMDTESADSDTIKSMDVMANLHVIHYDLVKPCPEGLDMNAAFSLFGTSLGNSMQMVRGRLAECMGDRVPGDLLCMHLVSTVFSRQPFPTCAFPLSVCGVADSTPFVQLLETLMTKVKVLDFTEAISSGRPLQPIKKCTADDDADRLTQTDLQLSDGTNLVLLEMSDEKKMSIDGATPFVESNAAALHRLISEQKLNFDFGFYSLPFDVDVPVIVLSRGRSHFISTPFRVCMPEGDGMKMAEAVRAFSSTASDQLHLMRAALATTRSQLSRIAISAETARAIQNDMVAMCGQPAAHGITPETKADIMHQLMVMARLATAIRGETEISEAAWEEAKELRARSAAAIEQRFPAPPPTETLN